jgi:hypothetical protein
VTMRSGRRRRQMRSTIRPTSPKCRSGSGMRIFRRRGCTVTARRVRRTVRRSRFPIEANA